MKGNTFAGVYGLNTGHEWNSFTRKAVAVIEGFDNAIWDSNDV